MRQTVVTFSHTSCQTFITHFLVFIALISLSNGDRIKPKIYKPIESNYFCFRRLNATHQIGCNSKEGGNVGVVHVVNDQTDIDHVLKTGQHYPYIPVITAKYFKLDILNQFKSSPKRITGVLVIDEKRTSEVTDLSPDKTCPNDGFGLYVDDTTYGHCGQQEWNSAGESTLKHNDGLMFNDWPFPIFMVRNATNIEEIKDCFKRYGGPEYPLCGIQLEAPMNAAKDSVACIRRTHLQKSSYSLSQTFYCDPLGGHNIFSTLLWTSKRDKISNDSVVVLSARLDSFSMFDNVSPGSDSALTSVVTLLAIAKTLNDYRSDIQRLSNDKNILYALFDGEAFDYIGSSRVAHDMSAGKFPVDPKSDGDVAQLRSEQFSHFIELNQLAAHGTDDTIYIHKNLKSNEAVSKLEGLLEKYAKNIRNFKMSSISDGRPLPPSSVQTFLKQNNAMGGVVIANHENEFTNKFYNSIYDDIKNVNPNDDKLLATRLTNVATVVSKAVYELLTGQQRQPEISVNQTLVELLLDCYTNNSNCDLFNIIMDPERAHHGTDKPRGEPLPTYVGVFGSSTLSSASRIYTHMLLSYLGGEELSPDVTKENCTQQNKESRQFSFYWMTGARNGTCIKSQAIKTDALSPAFLSEGQVTDERLYSTWTESRWTGGKVRIFLMPSPLQQWLTLIAGLILTLISFVFIYMIDKNSVILFERMDVANVPQQSLTVGL